jgi:predicted nucleic acid-binding protein
VTVEQEENGKPGLALAVADTQLVSAILVGRRRDREAGLLDRYAAHLRGKSLVLSFATVCELRYGCLKAGWAPVRIGRMEAWFREVAAIVMPDNDLVTLCASLRDTCRRNGHALSDKIHDSDRWIASTAIRHKIPLISNDIFRDVPGLDLLQERPDPGM